MVIQLVFFSALVFVTQCFTFFEGIFYIFYFIFFVDLCMRANSVCVCVLRCDLLFISIFIYYDLLPFLVLPFDMYTYIFFFLGVLYETRVFRRKKKKNQAILWEPFVQWYLTRYYCIRGMKTVAPMIVVRGAR